MTPRIPTPGGSAKMRVPHSGQLTRGMVLSFHVFVVPATTFTASVRKSATGMYAAP